jgi:hypothetical protein
MRVVDAAEFFHPGINVHEGLARSGNAEQCVALRGLLAQAASDQQDEVGAFHPRQQFGIGSDAEIARVAGMRRRKQMGAAKRGGDRQGEPIGKASDRGVGGLRPAAAAEQHDRALRRPEQLLQAAHVG